MFRTDVGYSLDGTICVRVSCVRNSPQLPTAGRVRSCLTRPGIRALSCWTRCPHDDGRDCGNPAVVAVLLVSLRTQALARTRDTGDPTTWSVCQ